MAWLSREALRRVLQSLLTAELDQVLQRQSLKSKSTSHHDAWPESLALGDEGTNSLGCDSLELLWLAAAVNEMFCLYDTQAEKSLLSASTFGEWIDVVDRGWNNAGRRITFSTSGSTGVPRRCTHDMSSLQREIEFLATHFARICRVLALAPPHHIYGFLFTAMLPSHMGVPVLPAEFLAPGSLLAELTVGDLIVSIPPRWEWLARSIPHWPPEVQGSTSTAPCPEPLKLLLAQNGLQRLTEIYGSSETAGIGIRVHPDSRYRLMPHWSWANRNADTPTLQDQAGHSITLQDHVEIAPDNTFTVRSRVDGAVQVGGVNVFPARLEELLRSLDGVAEAAVRLSAAGNQQRLKAFIVPDQTVEQPALLEALELWTRSCFASERIRSFTFGETLPRNAMGKLTDWDNA